MRKVSLANIDASTLLSNSLQKGQVVSFKVTGSSMRPLFYHQKTVVYIEPLNKPLQKYDIILVSSEEQLLLHRIIKLVPLTTRGDFLLSSETIREQDVLGIVQKYENDGKMYTIRGMGWKIKYCVHRMIVYLRYSIHKVVRRS